MANSPTTWFEEVVRIFEEAQGNLSLVAALCALRKTENGGPGKEFGVLSQQAPGFLQQCRIAANSFRNREREWHATVPMRDAQGFYSERFLRLFSSRWAPLNVANDPDGLNVSHANNLVALHQKMRAGLIGGLVDLG